jgi:hypothetical protein
MSDLPQDLAEDEGLRHAQHVIAAVDMDDLAGGAGAVVRAQPDRGAADRLQRGVGAQGGVRLGMAERAGAADGGPGEGLHRAGRDRVDADALRAKVIGQIAHGGFQRGLGHAHHVVVRRHPVRALEGQGDERAAVGIRSAARRATSMKLKQEMFSEFWKLPAWC